MIDRLEISATVYRPELTLEIHSVCLTGPSVTWNYRRARWVIALSIGKLLNPSHLVCYVRVLIVIEIRYGFHSFSLPFFFFSIIVHPTIFTELITRTTTTTDIRISFFSSLRIYEYVLFTSLINICPNNLVWFCMFYTNVESGLFNRVHNREGVIKRFRSVLLHFTRNV